MSRHSRNRRRRRNGSVELVGTLFRIIIEQGGAQKGYLVTTRGAEPATGEGAETRSAGGSFTYAKGQPWPRILFYAASFTTFRAASSMSRPTVKFSPESTRIWRPSSTLVPSMRTTIGT